MWLYCMPMQRSVMSCCSINNYSLLYVHIVFYLSNQCGWQQWFIKFSNWEVNWTLRWGTIYKRLNAIFILKWRPNSGESNSIFNSGHIRAFFLPYKAWLNLRINNVCTSYCNTYLLVQLIIISFNINLIIISSSESRSSVVKNTLCLFSATIYLPSHISLNLYLSWTFCSAATK